MDGSEVVSADIEGVVEICDEKTDEGRIGECVFCSVVVVVITVGLVIWISPFCRFKKKRIINYFNINVYEKCKLTTPHISPINSNHSWLEMDLKNKK